MAADRTVPPGGPRIGQSWPRNFQLNFLHIEDTANSSIGVHNREQRSMSVRIKTEVC
jgi:hypothetical protein